MTRHVIAVYGTPPETDPVGHLARCVSDQRLALARQHGPNILPHIEVSKEWERVLLSQPLSGSVFRHNYLVFSDPPLLGHFLGMEVFNA